MILRNHLMALKFCEVRITATKFAWLAARGSAPQNEQDFPRCDTRCDG